MPPIWSSKYHRRVVDCFELRTQIAYCFTTNRFVSKSNVVYAYTYSGVGTFTMYLHVCAAKNLENSLFAVIALLFGGLQRNEVYT